MDANYISSTYIKSAYLQMNIKSGFNLANVLPATVVIFLAIVLSAYISGVGNGIVYFLGVPFIALVDSMFQRKGLKYGEYVDFFLNILVFELLIIPFCDTDVLFFAFTHLLLIFARISHYITEGISKKRMFSLYAIPLAYLFSLIAGVSESFNPLKLEPLGHPVSPITRLAFAAGLLLVMILSVLDREHIEIQLKQKYNDTLSRLTQISALSSIISHNLKTPIASMSALLTIIEIDGLNENRLNTLNSSVARAVKEVNIMVNSRKFFSLDQSLFGYLNQWKSQYEHTDNIQLTEIPLFILDEPQAVALYVALETFTNNSFEHGASSVKIGATGDKQQIILYHQDDGEGMESEVLSRFGSIVKSAKKDHSGIGVYFTTTLLKATDIPFSVQSSDQHGTRIELTICKHVAQS